VQELRVAAAILTSLVKSSAAAFGAFLSSNILLSNDSFWYVSRQWEELAIGAPLTNEGTLRFECSGLPPCFPLLPLDLDALRRA
jgi:hypothetical protein